MSFLTLFSTHGVSAVPADSPCIEVVQKDCFFNYHNVRPRRFVIELALEMSVIELGR
jgi:hypothetical protein